jgi:hypothetical protein
VFVHEGEMAFMRMGSLGCRWAYRERIRPRTPCLAVAGWD